MTALQNAACEGKLDVVRWLATAEGGGLLTDTDNRGRTALQNAAFEGRLEVVRWLAANGGESLAAKDTRGRTALQHAQERGHDQVAELLQGVVSRMAFSRALFKRPLQGAAVAAPASFFDPSGDMFTTNAFSTSTPPGGSASTHRRHRARVLQNRAWAAAAAAMDLDWEEIYFTNEEDPVVLYRETITVKAVALRGGKFPFFSQLVEAGLADVKEVDILAEVGALSQDTPRPATVRKLMVKIGDAFGISEADATHMALVVPDVGSGAPLRQGRTLGAAEHRLSFNNPRTAGIVDGALVLLAPASTQHLNRLFAALLGTVQDEE